MENSSVTENTLEKPAYKDVRGTYLLVESIYRLLVSGMFPGGAAPQVIKALEFLQQFAQKVDNELQAYPEHQAMLKEQEEAAQKTNVSGVPTNG